MPIERWIEFALAMSVFFTVGVCIISGLLKTSIRHAVMITSAIFAGVGCLVITEHFGRLYGIFCAIALFSLITMGIYYEDARNEDNISQRVGLKDKFSGGRWHE